MAYNLFNSNTFNIYKPKDLSLLFHPQKMKGFYPPVRIVAAVTMVRAAKMIEMNVPDYFQGNRSN